MTKAIGTRQRCGIVLMVCALMLFAVTTAEAATRTAKLPDFPITLNGIEVSNNEYLQYPFLCYNDITYVPTTWYNCRFLGIDTQWSEETGLCITQNNTMTSSMGYYPIATVNAQVVSVSIPTFKVMVNGEIIDNSKESHPLLVFRDVTYFPLTWRFAHNAFGWAYGYTETAGLSITSHNPQTIAFPVLHERTMQTPIRLLDHQQYYYIHQPEPYSDIADSNIGHKITEIYQAPLDNRYRARKIYTFEQAVDWVDFAMLDDKPYMLYQQPGKQAVELMQITADGQCVATKLRLEDYTNGLSTGNQSHQWTYELRDKLLCRKESTENWSVCSDNTAQWYGLMKEQVYYLHMIDEQAGYLYRANDGSLDQKVTKEKIRHVSIQGDYLVCLLDEQEDYGAMLFDGDGNLQLSITGAVDMVSVSEDAVMAVVNIENGEDRISVIMMK